MITGKKTKHVFENKYLFYTALVILCLGL